MINLSNGLDELLGTAYAGVFRQEFWEKKPLWVQRAMPDFYAGLFSLDEFDHLISYSDIAYPEIRGVSKGRTNLSHAFFRNTLFSAGSIVNQINTAYKLYSEGCTLLIQGLQKRSRSVRELCRSIEAQLHHPVGVNAYVTPAQAQGFDLHFDAHDVLILQIEGNKEWELYSPSHTLPLDQQASGRFLSETKNSELYLRTVLQPGDLLYIPRGWPHSAKSLDVSSLHLTVGLHVFRWLDLMEEALLELGERDERFRRAVPPEMLNSESTHEQLEHDFRELLTVVLADASVGNAEARLEHRLLRNAEPLTTNRLSEVDRVAGIGLDTRLEKWSTMSCRITEADGDITIHFQGNQLTGPAKILKALQFISNSARPITAREIPGPLNETEVLVLLRRLVREGLLRQAS
jgi:ribosomal protein L16 Arg81 hydroxylase